MQILTLLPVEKLARVLSLAPDVYQVYAALDVTELLRIERSRAIDLLIIDPTSREVGGTEVLESALLASVGVPVLAYATVSARAMGLVLRLGRIGVRELVLFDVDDSTELFRGTIDRLKVRAVEDLLIEELRERLVCMPPGISRAVELLFRFPSVRELGRILRAWRWLLDDRSIVTWRLFTSSRAS